MIGRHVVGHEVDEQPHVPLGECGASGGEAGATTEALVDLVATDAVGRADHVGIVEVGQGRPERGELLGRFHRQLHTGVTAFPHPHQPHGVHARGCHAVPLGPRHIGQRGGDTGPLADVMEPGSRVELVDHRVGRPRAHFGVPR